MNFEAYTIIRQLWREHVNVISRSLDIDFIHMEIFTAGCIGSNYDNLIGNHKNTFVPMALSSAFNALFLLQNVIMHPLKIGCVTAISARHMPCGFIFHSFVNRVSDAHYAKRRE